MEMKEIKKVMIYTEYDANFLVNSGFGELQIKFELIKKAEEFLDIILPIGEVKIKEIAWEDKLYEGKKIKLPTTYSAKCIFEGTEK